MKRKLKKEEILDIIFNYPEQSKFDWKRNINISTDKAKSEIAKDVIAITNAHGNADGYIIYGVNPTQEDPFVGIRTSIDDSSIQQIVNSKINKPIKFLYSEQKIEKNRIGLIIIEKDQIRPFIVTKDFGILKEGTTPIRRGSSTGFANEYDMQMMFKDTQRIDTISNKASYVQKAIYDNAPALHIVSEYLELMKMKCNQQEIEWATAELKGYDEKLNKDIVENLGVEYRRVNGHMSIVDIEYTGILSFDQIRLQEPNYYWDFTFFFTMPILEIENMYSSDSGILQMSVPTKPLVKQGLPKSILEFERLFFYFKPLELKKLITGVKQRILSNLVSI